MSFFFSFFESHVRSTAALHQASRQHSLTRVPSIRHASRWASASANLRSLLLALTRVEARPRRGRSLRPSRWLRATTAPNRCKPSLELSVLSVLVKGWRRTTTSPLTKTNESPRGARSTRATPWRWIQAPLARTRPRAEGSSGESRDAAASRFFPFSRVFLGFSGDVRFFL